MSQTIEKMRLDKWLWVARFYKTRSLASTEVDRNRVKINKQFAKPAREVKVGDEITLQQGTGQHAQETVVFIEALSATRGPASIAQTLYTETPESIEAKKVVKEKRRFMNEPAISITEGRPTKRDRRKLAEWQRWSASADGEE